MAFNRRTVFLSVLTVWVQGCLAAPWREGSGAFPALKSEEGTVYRQTLAYFADQEGSGYSEASAFSSSSGTNPIYVQASSMEPSVEEALSSSIYIVPDGDATEGDSDIVFAESDTGESIPEDATVAESDLYELDQEGNQIDEEGEEMEGSEDRGGALGDNEVVDIRPTEPSESTTPSPEEGGNVIPNSVRHHHDSSNTGNDLNIVSTEHGNEVGGHKGQANGIGKEAKGDSESDGLSGAPGSGIMALVMFVAAIGVGAMLSFLLLGLINIAKKFFRKNPDP
ncbi:uncharacterized protein LOC110987117 [Acanthaster planci]|uniref:Uncharacterized protein LOC110987117 n=1 Tax=Acanthaster planci TaxID=133434 RepID=A0A8B7ZHX6_ACAPL|nr:uncharacterized protein LOC110987117 [Acanthaster planci]